MKITSCIYEGKVRHRRFTPIVNFFVYRLYMMYLDLDELPSLFRRRWLWSAGRPALAWFRRADHWGDHARPLADCIRDLVEEKTGARPDGPIRLLTHLRYFGYCFNPVSFYYCFDKADSRVATIVAEVHNTPWNETHCYVLDDSANMASGARKRFQFAKTFHVSPFMDMDHDYDWHFNDPADRLYVHMNNLSGGRKHFDATMQLGRTEISTGSLARVLLSYPLITVTIIVLIYWQALKLHLKGANFYTHPRKRHAGESSS